MIKLRNFFEDVFDINSVPDSIYAEKNLTMDIAEDLDFQGIEIVFKGEVRIRAYKSYKIKNLTLTKDPKYSHIFSGLDIAGNYNKPLIFENCDISCNVIMVDYLPFPIRKRTNIDTELIRFDISDFCINEKDLFKLDMLKPFKNVDDIIGKWFDGKILGKTINIVTTSHHFLISKSGNKYVKVEK